jgi:hypothetical protein
MDAATFCSEVKKDCKTLWESGISNALQRYLLLSLVFRIAGVVGVVFAGISFITILAAASSWTPFYLATACLNLLLSRDIFVIGCNAREMVCTVNDPLEEPHLLKKGWLSLQSIFVRAPKIAIKGSFDWAHYAVHNTWIALPIYRAYRSMTSKPCASSFEIPI